MSAPLYVFPNLELGDNVVCNGLCRCLARQHPRVVWVARRTYVGDVGKMFSDLNNVLVLDGYDYPEAKALSRTVENRLVMGYFNEETVDWRTVQWDTKFYAQAGVDFKGRWSSFNLPAQLLQPANVTCGVLTHEVPERGFVFDEDKRPAHAALSIVRSQSFWDWVPKLLSAREFHCVDSSYLNLAESLYALGHLRNTKLVFHSYPKIRLHNSVPPVLRAPWKVLP